MLRLLCTNEEYPCRLGFAAGQAGITSLNRLPCCVGFCTLKVLLLPRLLQWGTTGCEPRIIRLSGLVLKDVDIITALLLLLCTEHLLTMW
jgi:hypothetical protein